MTNPPIPTVQTPLGQREHMSGNGAPLPIMQSPPPIQHPPVPPPLASQFATAPPLTGWGAAVGLPQDVQDLVVQGLEHGATDEQILSYATRFPSVQGWDESRLREQIVAMRAQPAGVQAAVQGAPPPQLSAPAPAPAQGPGPAAIATQRKLKKADWAELKVRREQGQSIDAIAVAMHTSVQDVTKQLEKMDKPKTPRGAAAAPAPDPRQTQLAFQIGQELPGKSDVVPLELEMVRANGLDLMWNGRAWAVVRPARDVALSASQKARARYAWWTAPREQAFDTACKAVSEAPRELLEQLIVQMMPLRDAAETMQIFERGLSSADIARRLGIPLEEVERCPLNPNLPSRQPVQLTPEQAAPPAVQAPQAHAEVQPSPVSDGALTQRVEILTQVLGIVHRYDLPGADGLRALRDMAYLASQGWDMRAVFEVLDELTRVPS